MKNLFICVLAFCVWAAPVYANAQMPSTEGAPPAESYVRRIEALVKSLDTPENKPRDVEAKKEPQ